MFARLSFLLIAAFWLTMNGLLWRAEFGAHDPAGDFVPVKVVWRKILTAPDSSSLSIYRRGEKVGFCHWVTGVGEEFGKLDEAPSEGMAANVGGYRILFDGNVALPEVENRGRFECTLKLSTNQAWQEINVRLNMRPQTWEIHSVAAEQTVSLRAEEGEGRFERTFRFAELQNPEALLREFGGPFSLALVSGLGLPAAANTATAFSPGLAWQARAATLRVGHEPVRVYRLQTRLLDRYPVTIYVSRVGELLRAELPGDILLVHDQLINF